jgi:hypothetical protein
MATIGGAATRGQGTLAQNVWGQQGQDPEQLRHQFRPRRGLAAAAPPQIPAEGDISPRPPAGAPPRIPDRWGGPESSTMPVGEGVPYKAPGTADPGAAPGTAPVTPQPASGKPARGQQPIPAGTMDPYEGKWPVRPDGSYVKGDGMVDWLPGYGPQYNWGGMDIPTGQAPISPEPVGASPAVMDQWIQENLRAGRTLADLGRQPVRAGGLSAYMRYGGGVGRAMQGTSGGAGPRGTTGPEGLREGGGPGEGGAPPPVMSYGQEPGGAAAFQQALTQLVQSLYGSPGR